MLSVWSVCALEEGTGATMHIQSETHPGGDKEGLGNWTTSIVGSESALFVDFTCLFRGRLFGGYCITLMDSVHTRSVRRV